METQASVDTMMELQIAGVQDVAKDIRSFELVRADGKALPAFTAGSHIKVRTPNGQVRKYSLCNDPADPHFYQITVKRDAKGQGGSISMFDDAHAGGSLMVSAPENAFPLEERAKGFIFIAGGIGITPILSMIRSFGELPPGPWKLFYLTQGPETTAFADELNALGALNPSCAVKIHHDHGDPDRAFDLWPVLERPSNAHIYCCGPRGLMDAVRDMTGHWSNDSVHFESFTDGSVARPEDKPFLVRLAKSDKTIEVPVGKSILAAVKEQGCNVSSSCESGTCGTCRTGLLAGEADHRDMVLMPEEMASQIMICVSRAKSAELILDL
ncbi:MAG TPA: PDR/VanB family oxidoreductase [Herbaspirillum sp.]|jgi:phthalate 4,5-dioxygenase reductase subunit